MGVAKLGDVYRWFKAAEGIQQCILQSEMFGALNANQHKYLGAILVSAHRLVTAVNSILLYTNLVAGRISLEMEPCRLHELCAIAVRSLMRKADNKHQHITQEISPFGLEIESNPKGVLQVLKDLLENAIKFTPEEGSIELCVTALPDREAVSIVVADNGIGMSAEQLASIFHPFAQGDQTLARRFEGLGLGLAYVHEMVTRLGGTIAVTSTPAQGSRFTLTLPAARHSRRQHLEPRIVGADLPPNSQTLPPRTCPGIQSPLACVILYIDGATIWLYAEVIMRRGGLYLACWFHCWRLASGWWPERWRRALLPPSSNRSCRCPGACRSCRAASPPLPPRRATCAGTLICAGITAARRSAARFLSNAPPTGRHGRRSQAAAFPIRRVRLATPVPTAN